MPFIIGLILTPLGAIVATCAFMLLVIPQRAEIENAAQLLTIAEAIAPSGLLYGSLFIAPIALIVLPAAYALLRRRAQLGIGVLAATGMMAAIALMCGIIIQEQLSGDDLPFFARRTVDFSLIGGTAGVVVGAVFACIMRWWRPSDWRRNRRAAAPPKPHDRVNGPRFQPGGGRRR